jgi:hypothetical protein
MTDFTAIPDISVDPDAPVTSELMYALRDNAVAIAEGAVGAPRVMPKSLSSNSLGAIASTSTTPAGFTGIGGFRSIRASACVAMGVSNDFQVSYSADGGTTWGSFQNLYSSTDSGIYYKTFEINLVTGVFSGRVSGGSTSKSIAVSGTLTPLTNTNAIRFRMSGGAAPWSLFGEITGGRADV